MILSILNYNNVKYISGHKKFFSVSQKTIRSWNILFCPITFLSIRCMEKREYS